MEGARGSVSCRGHRPSRSPREDPLLPLAIAAALHLAVAAPPPPPARAGAAGAREGIDARRQSAERRDQALLEQKCAKCHPLSVATSTPLTLAQMKRHLKRPGLAASQAQLQRIADLLKRDAERRAAQ